MDSVSYIRHYQMLQIIISNFNDITRIYFFIVMNNSQILLAVLCNVLSIGFHAILSPFTLAFTSIFTFTSVSYLFITYFTLGNLNALTAKALSQWNRSSHQLRLNKVQKKQLRSCKPAEVYIGDFGKFQRIGAIRIVSKIVFYTVKIIVSSKKLGFV